MSWVKRMPPGDPAYFCDCPPCPFCFEWVDERGDVTARRTGRERPRMRRLVLPVLAGTAFLLTVGLTMRNQNMWATPLAAPSISPTPRPSPSPPPASVPAATPSREAVASEQPAIPSVPASGVVAPESVRTDTSGNDVTNELVPVIMRVRGKEHTAALKSMSSDPLTVSVRSRNPTGGNESIVQVSVPPNARVDLAETGLVIDAGNEITLHSPPYRDRTLVVQ